MPINLSPGEKKFSIVAFNVALLTALVGVLVFSINESEGAFHFYTFLTTVAWTPFIPLIGKLRSPRPIIPRLIFITLAVKMAVIATLEALDAAYFPATRTLFPGKADFDMQFLYAGNFLDGEPTLFPAIPGHSPIEVYYPPGVALVYVMLVVLNPAGSTLLYRWYVLLFEAGVYYFIWKIASLPALNISQSFRDKGVIYAFFGASFLSAIDFFGKYDVVLLLVVLVGIHAFFKDNRFAAGGLLVMAGFIKIFPFVWIGGILIHDLKHKRFKQMLQLVVGGCTVGVAILAMSFLLEGTRLFDLLLGFQFNIAEGAYAVYMMNFWFYLAYTGLPFVNFIPYIGMVFCLLYFFIRGSKEIDINFFIKSTAIVLIFYTAVNSVYINFIFPFICIGLLGSIKKVRVLALLEIASMWVEQLFNTIVFSTGMGGELILSLDAPPAWWFLAFRFANLGLFMTILVTLVLPERFERWFPLEAEGRIMEVRQINGR